MPNGKYCPFGPRRECIGELCPLFDPEQKKCAIYLLYREMVQLNVNLKDIKKHLS